MNKKQPLCTIIRPIGATDAFTSKDWQDIHNVISKCACEVGYHTRLASDGEDEVINQCIVDNIYEADVIVCDISTKNLNVLYELGIAMSFNKPCCIIYSSRAGDDLLLNLLFDDSFVALEYDIKDYLRMCDFESKLKLQLKQKQLMYDSFRDYKVIKNDRKISSSLFSNDSIVFVGHTTFGADKLMKNANKRIWLDALFYPYYSNTGDEEFILNFLNNNEKSEIKVIYPSKFLLEKMNDICPGGYHSLLSKRFNNVDELIEEIEYNMNFFKQLKRCVNDDSKSRFHIMENDLMLFNPSVLIDNTLLVVNFAHSDIATPNGVWVKHIVPDYNQW